jgi:hypothetical protein
MIGGVDTSIGGRVDREDIDVLLRLFHAGWPGGVCESSDGAIVISLRRAVGKGAPGEEFFVYRDEASKASWDEHGLTDDNGEAMVSVIVANDYIALVSGESTSESGSLATTTLAAIHRIRLDRRLTGTPVRETTTTEHV